MKKIIKVGNSAAVILPASFIKEGNLKIGDEVIVETMAYYQTAMIKPRKNKKTLINLSSKFFYWLEKVNKEY